MSLELLTNTELEVRVTSLPIVNAHWPEPFVTHERKSLTHKLTADSSDE